MIPKQKSSMEAIIINLQTSSSQTRSGEGIVLNVVFLGENFGNLQLSFKSPFIKSQNLSFSHASLPHARRTFPENKSCQRSTSSRRLRLYLAYANFLERQGSFTFKSRVHVIWFRIRELSRETKYSSFKTRVRKI
jgi:hypothetical protein